MKKQISEKIKIPSGVEVEIEGNKIIIKGKNGTNERSFSLSSLKLEKKGDEIMIGTEKGSKKEKMRMYTIIAHIKNMMKGVEDKFEYKLKICFGHFPITVEIKGKEAIIKNFLGEKVARKAKIPENAEVELNGDIITVRSKDIEIAGQAVANLETATRIPNRDRRVFQDGIFMTSKCGEPI